MDIGGILATKDVQAATVRPEQSVREALALLAHRNIGALIVVEGADHHIGILSARDIARRHPRGCRRSVGRGMCRPAIEPR